MIYLLCNFLTKSIEYLDENDYHNQIEYNGLEIEEVGISWKPIHPGNPHEDCIQRWKDE